VNERLTYALIYVGFLVLGMVVTFVPGFLLRRADWLVRMPFVQKFPEKERLIDGYGWLKE
jgi:hypothetical protein